ncbi:cysteine dioxygenase family protein [Microlunatus speluncae]|uniref:cysteine dioxygenase family protein n=1 Tax=Microlunatus speluncae TaxID=2594267 RepID=UPI0012667857|nr:cysteine dioxygenase family protein [Microlunatus speluncae]
MTTAPPSQVDQLIELVDGVRAAVTVHADWADTARLVAEELRANLPDPGVLTERQRLGSPDDHPGHTLYVEPDGSFSIIGRVWRPGQITRIHDHVAWSVFGVVQGVERQELFDAELKLISVEDHPVGHVSGVAPPGDLHRMQNVSKTTAISIHVYGADLTRLGTGVRRYYD